MERRHKLGTISQQTFTIQTRVAVGTVGCCARPMVQSPMMTMRSPTMGVPMSACCCVVALAPLGCSFFETAPRPTVIVEAIDGTGTEAELVVDGVLPDGVAARHRVRDRIVLLGEGLETVTQARLQLRENDSVVLVPIDDGDGQMRSYALPTALVSGAFTLTLMVGTNVAAQSTVFLLQGERGDPGPPGPPAALVFNDVPCLDVGTQKTINGVAVGLCEVTGNARWSVIGSEEEFNNAVVALQQVRVAANGTLVVPFDDATIAFGSTIEFHHEDDARIIWEGLPSTVIASPASPVAHVEAGRTLRIRGVKFLATNVQQIGVIAQTGARLELGSVGNVPVAIEDCFLSIVVNSASIVADDVVITGADIGVQVTMSGTASLNRASITARAGVVASNNASVVMNNAVLRNSDHGILAVGSAAVTGYNLDVIASAASGTAIFAVTSSFEGNGTFTVTGDNAIAVVADLGGVVNLDNTIAQNLELDAPAGRPHLFATGNAVIKLTGAVDAQQLPVRSLAQDGGVLRATNDTCTTDVYYEGLCL
jgi:hypothetical protein